MIVDQRGICDIFGCGDSTVRLWRRDGMPVHKEPETGKGVTNEQKKRLYDSCEVHRWLIQRATTRRW